MVSYRDNRSFIMADIPGIIEGAHQGKGLGLRFLRHIERNSILLFLIPAESQDHFKEYQILLKELQEYNPELLDKQRIIAISKCDLLDPALMSDISKEFNSMPHTFISSVTGAGIPLLKDQIWKMLTA